MARKIRPLTATEIKQAKPREKVWYLFDGDGLQLAIKPNGSKLWQFKYNSPTQESRRTISYGQLQDISLAQAREKRRECRSLISDGIDPLDYYKERELEQKLKHKNIMDKVMNGWLEHKKTYVSERTVCFYIDIIKNHLAPRFNKTRVDQITPLLVLDKLNYLVEQNKLATLRRTISTLNQMMRYAVSVGYIKSNCIEHLSTVTPKRKVENLKCIDPSDTTNLLNAIENAKANKIVKLLFKFQMLTLARPQEARGAEWCDIDLDKKTWCISAEKMKMRKSHTVQLSEQAIVILLKAKKIAGGEGYVFKSYHKEGNHKLSHAAVLTLISKAGFKGKMTAHGLRSLASTILNEHEFNPDIIESMLAHSSGGVRKIYNRSKYENRKRELYQWWADYCVKKGLVV